MIWPSIPPSMPHWLRRHPLLLAAVIESVNRLHRLVTTRWRGVVFVVVAVALLGGLLVTLLASAGRAAFAVQQALGYAGIVVAATGLYAASLISRRRREVEVACVQSWLIATPRVKDGSSATIALFTLLPLLWRLVVAVASAFLLSFDAAVTVEQSLQLSALITIGGIVGALSGWWLSRSTTRRHEGSRYTPRPRYPAHLAPSSAALSRWPIAQALAWGRPENARLLLGVAIVTVPGGAGLLGAVFILVTWIVASYLAAVLIAIPHVARSASEWLRTTPITFWAFAWPLASRALLHQLCGTLIAIGVMLMLGSSLFTAIYFGTLWLTFVMLIAALSLADCYRARSPTVKTTLSILTALLAEERAHGWGISLALLLTALHLRMGASHERA